MTGGSRHSRGERRGAPEGAGAGLVVAAWRRHYAVDLDTGETIDCVL